MTIECGDNRTFVKLIVRRPTATPPADGDSDAIYRGPAG